MKKDRFKTEPVAISDLVRQATHRLGLSRNQEHQLVFQAWDSVIPKDYQSRMRPYRFYGGCLTVAVSSAPLLEEVLCYRQSEFLALLNQELDTFDSQSKVVIRKLDFRRN